MTMLIQKLVYCCIQTFQNGLSSLSHSHSSSRPPPCFASAVHQSNSSCCQSFVPIRLKHKKPPKAFLPPSPPSLTHSPPTPATPKMGAYDVLSPVDTDLRGRAPPGEVTRTRRSELAAIATNHLRQKLTWPALFCSFWRGRRGVICVSVWRVSRGGRCDPPTISLVNDSWNRRVSRQDVCQT